MITKNLTLAISLCAIGIPTVYDSGKAGWKLDSDGKIVVDSDGNPVYIDTKGQELALGVDTVSRLNGEAKANRERAEKAEEKFKPFEGLDPTAAKKALETVSNLDHKKLIDAGEVERVKNEIRSTMEAQIKEKDDQLSASNTKLANLAKQTAFQSSKYIEDSIAVPRSMMQATFGNNFDFDGDKLIPKGPDGNPVMSRKRAGETADFDEALSIMVDSFADRDSILKAGKLGGSGNNGNGGANGGGRVVRRADFAKLEPSQQAEIAAKAGKGELTIAD